MLQFLAHDENDTPYKLQRAVKESGLSHQQICDRLPAEIHVLRSNNRIVGKRWFLRIPANVNTDSGKTGKVFTMDQNRRSR